MKPAKEIQFPVLSTIEKRWSPRAFSDKLIETEKINRLFEAARWAPSAFNAQPWRFVYATKDHSDAYDKIAQGLNPWNQKWAAKAPLLVFVLAKKTFDHNGKPNAYAWYDAGQAAAYLSLQATEMDLYLHQMAGIEPDVLRNVLEIGEDYDIVAGMAIGYLGDAATLPDDLREREHAAPTRKPHSELVSRNDWTL